MKNFIILICMILFQFVDANTISFDIGWQIRGCDTNISLNNINSNAINSIWAYRNGKWYAYFFNKNNKNSILKLNQINKNEGFWIFANDKGSFNISSNNHISKLHIKRGWHMYGTDMPISNATFDNANVKIVFAFNNKLNRWKAYSSDAEIMKLIKESQIEIIDNLNANEGFWVFADADVNLTLQQAKQENNNVSVYGIKVYGKNLSFSQYKLAPITDSDFNSLSEDNKYLVANKLLGSLFYGLPYEELKEKIDSGNFISYVKEIFSRDPNEENLKQTDEKMEYYIHNRDYDVKRIAPIMARLYELNASKYFIDNWTAYVLTQSIMFSPAYELATVNFADVMNVYRRLVDGFEQGFSLKWITFSHMISDDNWRRFRSPEDNGREMLEIFLMDYNDSHVPLAAKALKNWKLDKDSNSLEITMTKNREPITDLFPGTIVTDGFDFYSKLVSQPNFLPTVTRRLVDIYFPNFNETKKEEVVNKIVLSHPQKWQDILKQIVFSKEYLFHSQRIKSFEEVFYHVARVLPWDAKYNTFSAFNYFLQQMHQATMKYKLGRKVTPPTDTQSLVWYTKAVRERVLANPENNTSLESTDDGWNVYKIFDKFPDNLYGENELRDDGMRLHDWYVYERKRAAYMVNYLFVSIIGRKPTNEELNFFVDLIDDEKRYKDTYDNLFWLDTYGNKTHEIDVHDREDFISVILDYLSRLDDTYMFKAIKEGE